ncbi:hypothetical protein MSM1_16920 [Mycobacterium sp. SM1]|uniref:hypothetical protein n=1 Tax=Mycobacterium sp. SM1 TaxID=2816243 RepID=UPI001BD0F975|nr:hypothetical protein [Mycobacterium sp. SM1]MBS4729951.1 hypothetical protein [Mycobacterium sp. SM1]
MSRRLSPAQRLQAEIDGVFAGGEDLAGAIEEVARLGAEVMADYWAIFDLPDNIQPGLDAVTLAQNRIDAFAKRWRDSYPAAVRALLDDRDSLTV